MEYCLIIAVAVDEFTSLKGRVMGTVIGTEYLIVTNIYPLLSRSKIKIKKTHDLAVNVTHESDPSKDMLNRAKF